MSTLPQQLPQHQLRPLPTTHPYPILSRRITRLLWISIGLQLVLFAVCMINLGILSLFTSPAFCFLTLIHHTTLLILTKREEKGKRIITPFPSTSTKPTIFCTWFLVVAWGMIFGVTLGFTIWCIRNGMGPTSFSGIAEIILVTLITPLMAQIALRCTRERQHITGAGSKAKWYQVGEYQA